ncbi:MAG: FxLYD domain-containing protein [Patescibacteria group bacterium]|nr:FxLYD domain-containing protein [Patescibacteria group bacterium]
MSWSSRRKIVYAGVAVGVVLALAGLLIHSVFYKPATCFDGMKNGNEQGVDCGGSCTKLCPSSFVSPIVAWKRYQMIAPGVYNIAAYIINPNTAVGAKNVPYRMALYDTSGQPLTELDGMVTLPPHRNTLAFAGGVKVSGIPAASFFQFTDAPNWVRQTDPLSSLVVGAKDYSEDDRSSRLQVTLSNTGVTSLQNIAVYVVLYDASGNTLGFSKTVIDSIPAGGSAIAPFTWPVSYHGAVISQEVLPVAE